jgi:putative ABC transport system permease protein
MEGNDGPIPVSVETGIAKTLEVGLGDELVFDVQGVPLTTKIASLREVDWRRLQPNFFVVFPRGSLEEAPAFHVFVTRVESSEQSARLQRQVVRQFPNVSTIDLTLVLQTVDSVIGKISFVIRFMALFTGGTGLLVLIGTVLTGRFQRIQESILLRTLGASRQQILRILIVEYLALGTLAAMTGVILAVTGSWALAHFLFKVGFSLSLAPILAAISIVSALTVLTGMLMSRGICHHPPLEILRAES